MAASGVRCWPTSRRLAVERGGGRLEWWVLRTNEAALRFYQRLGARPLDEIEVMRLDGAALERLATSRVQ